MKQKIKQIVSILLAVIMLIGIAPLTDLNIVASAESYGGTCGDNLFWTLNTETGEFVISGEGDMYAYSSGSEWYDYRSYIKSVTIGIGVTSVCAEAFKSCYNITSITVDEDSTEFSTDEYGVLFNKDKTELILCPQGNTMISYSVPEGVISIGDYSFFGCESLTNVIISDGVISIGDYSFYSCDSLTDVTISDSVISIGKGAFCWCSALESLTIGSGVTSIGENAFDVNNHTIGSRSIDDVFYTGDIVDWCAIDFTNYYSNPMLAGSNFYIDGTLLENLVIPDSVTSISTYAFCDCNSLSSVTIGSGITSIEKACFDTCKNLTSITVDEDNAAYSSDEYGVLFDKAKTELIQYPAANTQTAYIIPDGVTSIRSGALSGSDFECVTIPDSVISIGEYAFSYCNKLTDVYYMGDIAGWCSIDFDFASYAFSYYSTANPMTYGDNLYINGTLIEGDLVLSDSVTSISDGAFYDCDSITSVTIPDSVTSIGAYAFYGCNSLASIEITDSVNRIGRDAFYGTKYYNYSANWENEALYIGNHLIDVGAFSGKYIIKEGTKTIAEEAFYECETITGVVIPDSVTSIGAWAFAYCYKLKDVYYTGDIAGWCGINNTGNPMGGNDNLYIDGKLIKGELIIPDGVTSIGVCAFSNCDSITKVTIPDSVTSISTYAFSGCDSITSVTIPDSVTSIGVGAFACPDLVNVYYTGDIEDWCAINFAGNNSNPMHDGENLYIKGTLIEGDLVIPDGVTSIGAYAFYDCDSITRVTIPDSVTSIGAGAFDVSWPWMSSVSVVYYNGTEEEWKKIADLENNSVLRNATVYFLAEHNLSHITVPATCTATGMEYDLCVDCGKTFYTKTLERIEHSWSDWSVDWEATVSSQGRKSKMCSSCSKVEYKYIPKLNQFVDEKSGIEIVFEDEFDSDVEIKVEEVFDGASFQLIDVNYGKNQTKIFDISTVKYGEKVQPDGKVKVRIPLPEGFGTKNIYVCYVDSVNGNVTDIPAKVVNGYVEFETDHFSYYAIVEKLGKVNSVAINDISMSYKDGATITPTIDVDEGVEYTVEYSSSDSSVAQVDKNGKVTTTDTGNTTITCTVTDEYGNTVTDTCEVEVKYKWWQWIIVIVLFGWIWY